MKKIISFLALFTAFSLKAVEIQKLDLNQIHSDTTIVLSHPNSTDSAFILNVVSGILSVVPVVSGNSFLNSLSTNPQAVAGITGIIFFLIRLFEKMWLRRKGHLVDKKNNTKPMSVVKSIIFLFFISSYSFGVTPLDSIQSQKKQANKFKLDLNTYETVLIYKNTLGMTTVPVDSINAWKNKANVYKIDLNTYLTALINSKTSSTALTGSGTANYLPMYSSSNTFTNSTIYYNGSNHLVLGNGSKAVSTNGLFPIYGGYGNSFESGLIASSSDMGCGGFFRLGNTGYTTLSHSSNSINYYAYSGHTFSVGASVAALKINIDGNVGIGTTSPTEKLDVSGNVRILSPLDAISGGLSNATYSLSVRGGWRSSYYSDNGYGTELAFYTNGLKKASIYDNYGYTVHGSEYRWSVNQPSTNTSKFWVDVANGGNVGIGSSYFVPTAYLHLAKSTTSNASLRIETGTAPASPNAGDIYTDSNHIYIFLAGAWKQLDN